MSDSKITYEELNALADGELSAAEQDRLLTALENDPEAQTTLCSIQHSKELIRHAYPLEDIPDKQPAGKEQHVYWQFAASLLLLLTGFTIGWHTSSQSINNSSAESSIAAVEQPATGPGNTIIYIGESNPAKFKMTLDKATELLVSSNSPDSRIYVVASAGGLDLLRRQTSPYQEKMLDMLDTHEALRFVACNNTIYRFKQDGKPVNLIKGTEVAPSAVEFVASHLKKGWRYISI